MQEAKELLERDTAAGVVHHRFISRVFARAALLLGQLEIAQTMADRAFEYYAPYPAASAHVLHLLGDIARHADGFDADRARAYYQRALALAKPRGIRPVVAHCHLGLGTLHCRTGRAGPAREHLATATMMYREMDMRFWIEQADAAMRETA
jgi:tetratricopeptide (TPR) repeat protein